MTNDITTPTVGPSELTRRLKRNRVELQDFLQDGTVPKKTGASGFQKAIRALNDALDEHKDWAVRMTLEYAVGKSQQYVHAMQQEDDGAPEFDIREMKETISRTRTMRRLRSAPNGNTSRTDVEGGDGH